MKKSLIACLLGLSFMTSANAAVVSLDSKVWMVSGTTLTFTESSEPKYIGLMSGSADPLILDFTRTAFNTRFSIFADIDGRFNDAARFNQTSLIDSFVLNALNPSRSVTLSAGIYVIKLFADDAVRVGTAVASVSPAPVPVPAVAWLFGSALLGVGALRRKQQIA